MSSSAPGTITSGRGLSIHVVCIICLTHGPDHPSSPVVGGGRVRDHPDQGMRIVSVLLLRYQGERHVYSVLLPCPIHERLSSSLDSANVLPANSYEPGTPVPTRTPHTFSAQPTGVARSRENAPPWDPTVGLCLGPYGRLAGACEEASHNVFPRLDSFKRPTWHACSCPAHTPATFPGPSVAATPPIPPLPPPSPPTPPHPPFPPPT